MATTLCLDFGNTRKKAAIFNDSRIVGTYDLPDNDVVASLSGLVSEHSPQKAILSSVIDHDPAIENLLSGSVSKFHKLDHKTKLAFTTPVGKPETIGADRLALAAAAVKFHPGKNNLVISMGTCITYNFINKFNEFLGGSISPGMDMRFKAMHQFTAKLPYIKADSNVPLLGYDTNTNLLSGGVLGTAFEIDGFIDSYANRYRNFNVLLTGGDSVYLASHLKNRIFADPELIFKGLYAISEVNNS